MRRPDPHNHPDLPRHGRGGSGFTVLELMLSIAIMTVIVIALYTVFDQTQRALRSTMSQVDVLEGIRASSDLVGREIEGAGHLPVARYTNVFVARNPQSIPVRLNRLTGDELMLTVLQNILFHVKVGEQWAVIGYWVGPRQTNESALFSVGRMYRFSTNLSPAQVRSMATLNDADRNAPLLAFRNPATRMAMSAPVVDGIVHFRVTAYAASGVPIYGTNLLTFSRELNFINPTLNTDIDPHKLAADPEATPGESVQYSFSKSSYPNAPATLEIEMGILEPQVLRQYESIAEAQPAEGARFLARNAGKIHLFRQRIPLRNAPPF